MCAYFCWWLGIGLQGLYSVTNCTDSLCCSFSWNPNFVLSCSKDVVLPLWIYTLRPRQNGCHFRDGIFKCIFLNENLWYLNKIPLKFVPDGPINNTPALVQIMVGCRSGDKPLSELMMVNLLMHICATQPQWVKLVLCRIYQGLH